MINRSSNVSARRSGGGDSGAANNGPDDTSAHITDLSTKSSSLSKKLKVKSSARSNNLPLLIAAFALGIIGRPLLIPPPSRGTHHNAAIANNDYESDTPSTTTNLRGGTETKDTTSNYYQLTPKTKLPKGWQNYSRSDIRSHFKCSRRTQDTNKSLPSLDDWQFLRYAYTTIVDNTKQREVWDNDVVPPTMGYSIEEGVPIPPPYYAKFSQHEKGGRGLYASRFIKKGELVHNGDVSDVIFPSTMKWKEYVLSLPRNLACDVTDWHWMQMKYKGDTYHMVGAMDISLLMNAGGPEWGDIEQKLVNVLPRSKYSGRQYATRDIEMGEEILTDYDAYYTNWKLVGLA